MDIYYEKIKNGSLFRGNTLYFAYFMLAISVFLLFSFLNIIIPIILILASLFIILTIEAVEIDYVKREIRKTVTIVFFKIGEWEPIENYEKLVFGADHETYRLSSPFMPLIAKDINTRAYDIYIIHKEDPKKSFLILNCKSIPKGEEKLEEYAVRLQIEKVDLIREGWERARERDRRR
jgi:hypothetical protein